MSQRINLGTLSGFARGIARGVALIRAAVAEREVFIDDLICEVRRRGGETTISHMPYGCAGLSKVQTRELRALDEAMENGRRLVLLRCEGYRYYSRRFGAKKASLAYLAGEDDNGLFAVRVPGTCDCIAGAQAWLCPATARRPGTIRQGNVYAVPSRSRQPVRSMGRHQLLPCTLDGQPALKLVHTAQDGRRAHEMVLLPGRAWTLVEQTRLDTQRGRTRD
jgi:hypothetical protein